MAMTRVHTQSRRHVSRWRTIVSLAVAGSAIEFMQTSCKQGRSRGVHAKRVIGLKVIRAVGGAVVAGTMLAGAGPSVCAGIGIHFAPTDVIETSDGRDDVAWVAPDSAVRVSLNSGAGSLGSLATFRVALDISTTAFALSVVDIVAANFDGLVDGDDLSCVLGERGRAGWPAALDLSGRVEGWDLATLLRGCQQERP